MNDRNKLSNPPGPIKLPVTDLESNESIGYVAKINHQKILLILNQCYETGTILSIRITFPAGIGENEHIELFIRVSGVIFLEKIKKFETQCVLVDGDEKALSEIKGRFLEG